MGTVDWRLVRMGTETSVTLSGLTPGTVYEAWVRAANDEGRSPRSGKGRGSTNANSPPVWPEERISLSVAENSADGTLVGSVEATDADGDVLTYSFAAPHGAVRNERDGRDHGGQRRGAGLRR